MNFYKVNSEGVLASSTIVAQGALELSLPSAFVSTVLQQAPLKFKGTIAGVALEREIKPALWTYWANKYIKINNKCGCNNENLPLFNIGSWSRSTLWTLKRCLWRLDFFLNGRPHSVQGYFGWTPHSSSMCRLQSPFIPYALSHLAHLYGRSVTVKHVHE